MKFTRKGAAVWQGGLEDGKGTVSTQSGVLSEQPYGFSTRFGDEKGTNPEELIAAAHAGCFTMALSKLLGEQDLTAERLQTAAEVTIEKVGEGIEITSIALTLEGTVPGASSEQFEELANAAKVGCPVSQLFNAPITLSVTLN